MAIFGDWMESLCNLSRSRSLPPPIWFGGRHPNGLGRAALYADGWMGAGSTSTSQFRMHLGIIRDNLLAFGCEPSQFVISKCVYVAVNEGETRPESRLRKWFGRRYDNTNMASEVSIWG